MGITPVRREGPQEMAPGVEVTGSRQEPCRLGCSAFDEGLQAGEGVVPLTGDVVQVVFEIVDRLLFELVLTLAPLAAALDEAGLFEDAQMFADGLARERRAF